MYDDSTAGQTFELYGPKEYSTREIANLVDKEILKKRRHINLPRPVFRALASAFNYIWWPTISPDEVERQFINQVIDPRYGFPSLSSSRTDTNDCSAKTFKDLRLEPDDISSWVLHYTRQYRYLFPRNSVFRGHANVHHVI